jgi:uncharacterized protein YndB with AHSA1/START domain
MSAVAQANPSLTIRRRIAAPPSKVFAAWTKPEKMMGWWGTKDAVTLRADVDLRVGGAFAVGFRTPDGEEHNVCGIYREIVADARLVFTWAWRSTPERESLVTVTIRPDGDGSMLTLHHEAFFDRSARDNHEDGWTSSLDRLEAYVEAA